MEYTVEDLLKRINELEAELKASKKYGLVWDKENTKEDVVLACEKRIPILEQDESKKIVLGEDNNILIEGDNYHVLTSLNMAIKESIDIIYIDPPYNTGHEDFVYNDRFVNEDDEYRHSKWLSFMNKRLVLARDLLKDDGVIFISIDDNEFANLKLLCDAVFGNNGFINNFMWLHGKGKKNKQSRTLQQYTLAYCKKNRDHLNSWSMIKTAQGDFSNPDNDPRGNWFSGSISFSESRSNKNSDKYFEIESPSGKKWKRQWQCTKEEMEEYLKDNKIYFGNPPEYSNVPRIKIFPTDENELIPDNILDNCGTTRSAQKELDKMIGTSTNTKGKAVTKFDNPKPHELIEHLIRITNKNENITVLDFFAGSGTTGQAVLELNKEDGGHRHFILCTNNEISKEQEIDYFVNKGYISAKPRKDSKDEKRWLKEWKQFKLQDIYKKEIESDSFQNIGICKRVTYPRLKTIITGVRADGSKYSEGLPSNLYYFKTNFIDDNRNTEQAKYNLVEKVDSLLCIKENIFEEIERNEYSSHFVNGDKHLFIYNDYFNEEKFVELKERVLNSSGDKIVYVYCSDNNIDESLIEGDNITLKPIPSKIYEIYKEIVEGIKRGE